MNFDWPLVSMTRVDNYWRVEVMKGSSVYSQIFQGNVPERVEFTARAMVYVISTRTREEVSWFFEESSKLEKVLQVYDDMHAHPEKTAGFLVEFVQEYYAEYRRYTGERLQ